MKISNVKIEMNQFVMNSLKEAADRALELTAQAILSDLTSRKVIPKSKNDLERSHFVAKVDQMAYEIVSSSSYARRWYFNLPIDDKLGRHYEPATFQKTENPNAQDHWMDYYLDGEGKEWVINTYMDFWKQESGGIIK